MKVLMSSVEDCIKSNEEPQWAHTQNEDTAERIKKKKNTKKTFKLKNWFMNATLLINDPEN